MVKAMDVLLLLVVTLMLAGDSEEVCCKRKGNFGCCGNGPCNIFCCHCSGGCNQQCEKTHCDSLKWLECAGLVAACSAQCVYHITDPECVKCFGDLYDECKTCYSAGNSKRDVEDTVKMITQHLANKRRFEQEEAKDVDTVVPMANPQEAEKKHLG